MHGPKPRSHAIKLNKKVRRLGLKIALSARAAEGKARLSLSLWLFYFCLNVPMEGQKFLLACLSDIVLVGYMYGVLYNLK